MKIIKKSGRTVRACCLGEQSELEQAMLAAGRLRRLPDGRYELFSQEAVHQTGQIARAGDYMKIDGKGFPYPNERAYFLTRHRHVEGDTYEQIPEPLQAWQAGEPGCPELDFLLDSGALTIREEDPQHYFHAVLWGAPLSAARDAVLVFYKITRRADGAIEKIRFNFVAREEFLSSYDVLE